MPEGSSFLLLSYFQALKNSVNTAQPLCLLPFPRGGVSHHAIDVSMMNRENEQSRYRVTASPYSVSDLPACRDPGSYFFNSKTHFFKTLASLNEYESYDK